jgi:hypothetical protein
MKLCGICGVYAVYLDALEGLDQVPSNMFPISWLMCLPRNDEQFHTHPNYRTVCTGVTRLYEFHFHSDYWYPASGFIICPGQL